MVWSKKLFKQIKNFPQYLLLFKHGKKYNFLSISVLFFRDRYFYVKSKVLYEFPTKMLQNNRKA